MPENDSHALLVVAAEEIRGPELRDAVCERARDRSVEVHVVAPALTETRFQHAAGAVDEARRAAQARLEHSLEEIRKAGVEATGEVGDSDLRLAIEDQLRAFDADEILIVAHRDNPPAMEQTGIAEAERRIEAPITELYVTGNGDAPHIAEVQEVAPEEHAGDGEVEVRGYSSNMPSFSAFDLAGILVAIIGTGILVVLAANCGGDTTLNTQGGFGDESGFGGCEIRTLLAGGFGLLNLAHVVGLMLFQAERYRGFWRDFFVRISLIGTPIAVVVSVLLSSD